MALQVSRAGLGRSIAARPLFLSIGKLLVLGFTNLPLIRAAPIGFNIFESVGKPDAKKPNDPRLWIYLGVAVFLVLLGGIFAGLTIAYVFYMMLCIGHHG